MHLVHLQGVMQTFDLYVEHIYKLQVTAHSHPHVEVCRSTSVVYTSAPPVRW